MFGCVAHQLAAFLGRMGGDDLDALSVEVVVVEREAGAFVHGGIVVDDRDLPRRLRRGGWGAPASSITLDEIVVSVMSDCVKCCRLRGFCRFLPRRGQWKPDP